DEPKRSAPRKAEYVPQGDSGSQPATEPTLSLSAPAPPPQTPAAAPAKDPTPRRSPQSVLVPVSGGASHDPGLRFQDRRCLEEMGCTFLGQPGSWNRVILPDDPAEALAYLCQRVRVRSWHGRPDGM